MSRPLNSPFLLGGEAANYLRVSIRTLRNWRWNGKGPAYRKHGQVVVYHIDDLREFSKVWNRRGSGDNG